MSHTDLKKYEQVTPILLAVDNIVFGVRENKLKILLFKRQMQPHAGEWSLLGAFVEPDESVQEAADRVLQNITGLEGVYKEQLHCFADPERDSGGRVASVAYWSLIKINEEQLEFNVRNHHSKWFFLDEIPSLVLDHDEMVARAVDRLRERATFRPVGFEVLPKEFTVSQLRKVYEAIFDKEIDDRNFRKKMLGSGLLIQLPKKDMTTSKKGSYLYEFNLERYIELSKNGYHFYFV